MTTTRRLFIHGRVQGIGFRWALMNEAKKLGLGGWVRNCNDGSVESLLIGPLEAVDDLTLWITVRPKPGLIMSSAGMNRNTAPLMTS